MSAYARWCMNARASRKIPDDRGSLAGHGKAQLDGIDDDIEASPLYFARMLHTSIAGARLLIIKHAGRGLSCTFSFGPSWEVYHIIDDSYPLARAKMPNANASWHKVRARGIILSAVLITGDASRSKAARQNYHALTYIQYFSCSL